MGLSSTFRSCVSWQWDKTPCIAVVPNCRWTYSLYLQGRRINQHCGAYLLALLFSDPELGGSYVDKLLQDYTVFCLRRWHWSRPSGRDSRRSHIVSRRQTNLYSHSCALEDTITILAGAERMMRGRRRHVNRKWPRWFTPNCVSNPSSVLPLGHAMIPETDPLRADVCRLLGKYEVLCFLWHL
jgi:hypothetical protein